MSEKNIVNEKKKSEYTPFLSNLEKLVKEMCKMLNVSSNEETDPISV